ncbi:MAG TPA: 3-deoxy-manno-octulosonate cytidylyltransferase [Gammaproteobacteria bacterium]|nr:3-deoxy-manno-octulosonate cytidylyltransferase [Gammaproteobacteria bacterium]
MNHDCVVIIPARYAATRLPGKPLLEIQGKPLIRHVHEAAAGADCRVIIATDDELIAACAAGFGAEVVRTAATHASGTDRIAEAAAISGIEDAMIVVNVQVDEYGLPPALVTQVADGLRERPEAAMATLCEPLRGAADYHNPNVVKVVRDANQYALYFSRSPLPWSGQPLSAMPLAPLRHIGIYAYRAGFLKTFAALARPPLEVSERLEQLRALHHGYRIHVAEAAAPCGIGIDTPADLDRARRVAAEGQRLR